MFSKINFLKIFALLGIVLLCIGYYLVFEANKLSAMY